MGMNASTRRASRNSTEMPKSQHSKDTYTDTMTGSDFPQSSTWSDPAISEPPHGKRISPVHYGHARLHSETEQYGISLPLRRQQVRQLSELIDPTSLFADNEYVKSPSGNLLGRDIFSAREDRPLSLRERQERIRQGLGINSSYTSDRLVSAQSSPQSSDFEMYTHKEVFAVEKKAAKRAKRANCWCF